MASIPCTPPSTPPSVMLRSPPPGTALGLALALVLSAGCGGEESATPSDARRPAPADGAAAGALAVRDSAGVRLVESAVPAWGEGEGWRVAPEPAAILAGTGDPGFALFRVVDLAVLPGGAVAVANAGSAEVAVLDADGRLRTTLGGAGEGPGEFEWLNGVLARGDTVVGVDGAALRLSLFAPDGALARELVLDPARGAPTGMRVADLGAAGVGVFREVGFAEKMPEPGVMRLPGTAFILAWSGERTPPLEGDFAGGAIHVAPGAMGALPMGPDLHLAGSVEGFVVGDGARPELRVHRPDGTLRRLVRWRHTPAAVDEAMRERWRAAELATLRREMDRGAGGGFGAKAATPEARRELETYYRGQLERTPFPDRVPAFSGLLIDDTGHTWVRRWRFGAGDTGPAAWQGKGAGDDPAGGTDWWVFAPDGRWLGTVRTPPRLRVMAVTATAVWGVHRDEFEVETVRRHALLR